MQTGTQRKHVNLTADRLDFLRQEAERLGLTVSELLRRIIDQYREGRES